MKKIGYLLLAMVLLFSLTACGSKTKYPTDAQVIQDMEDYGELPMAAGEVVDFKSSGEYATKDGMLYIYGVLTHIKNNETLELEVYALYEVFDDDTYKYAMVLRDK